MRYFWQFSIVAIACLISMGCAPITQPPRETITFDYAPETEAPPGSANVTFAIVGVQFVVASTHQQGMSPQQNMLLQPSQQPPPLFLQLASNMTKDFEEVLTARGYGIRGYFDTFDEMIYPDKEGSDLILTAKIKFRADTSGIQYTRDLKNVLLAGCGCSTPVMVVLLAGDNNPGLAIGAGLGYALIAFGGALAYLPKNFVPVGHVQISSEVTLEAYEGLTNDTNEIMWSKRIPISPFTIEPKTVLRGERNNLEQITWQELMKVDNKFYSDMGRAFESQYDKILSQIYTYLDPREMAIVKNQSMELRKKKVH